MLHFETQESTDHEVVFGSGAVSPGSSHDASTQGMSASQLGVLARAKKKRKRAAGTSAATASRAARRTASQQSVSPETPATLPSAGSPVSEDGGLLVEQTPATLPSAASPASDDDGPIDGTVDSACEDDESGEDEMMRLSSDDVVMEGDDVSPSASPSPQVRRVTRSMQPNAVAAREAAEAAASPLGPDSANDTQV